MKNLLMKAVINRAVEIAISNPDMVYYDCVRITLEGFGLKDEEIWEIAEGGEDDGNPLCYISTEVRRRFADKLNATTELREYIAKQYDDTMTYNEDKDAVVGAVIEYWDNFVEEMECLPVMSINKTLIALL